MLGRKAKQEASTLDSYAKRIEDGILNPEDLRSERDVILDLYQHHLKLLLEANELRD